MKKKCLICGKTIYKKQNQSLKTWNNVVKYCSRRCVGLSTRDIVIKRNLGIKGWKHSRKSRRKMSISSPKERPWTKGRKHTKEQKERIAKAIIKAQTQEVRLKKSLSHIGNKNHNWKGGRTNLKVQIRAGYKYRQWRKEVFTRDKFTCKKCNDNKGGNLEAHHIKSLMRILDENNIKTIEDAYNCDELWDVSNGITFCKECHIKEHIILISIV